MYGIWFGYMLDRCVDLVDFEHASRLVWTEDFGDFDHRSRPATPDRLLPAEISSFILDFHPEA